MYAAGVRAGVYGRESQDNQRSVADQVGELVAGCDGRGWSVADIYTDGSSASRFRKRRVRGDWSRLVDDVRAGRLDVICVWEPSRGDRDLESWVPFVSVCRGLGVLIHAESHHRTYDPRNLRDWRSLVEDGLDAAYESEKISSRTLRGIRSQVASGRPHGRTTYGHERIYQAETGRLIRQQPHPIHGPIVASIITQIAESVPVNQIVRALIADGTPTPERGARWRSSTVRAIATNPVHVGKRFYRGEMHDGAWSPLVDLETFERAQRVLTEPGRKHRPPGATLYLLSHLATSPCGGPLAAVGYGHSEGTRMRYGCFVDQCSSIIMPTADQVVRDVVIAWLARPNARDLLAPDDSAAATAHAEADALQRRIDDARDSAARPDGISMAALAKIERELGPLADAARGRARAVAAVPGLDELVDAAQASEARALELWSDWSVPARRGVVTAVMTVELLPVASRLTRWASDADRLEAAWERLRITPRQTADVGSSAVARARRRRAAR